MNGSGVVGSREGARILNAVPLQNAVLCAECDVVSDSPHDVCMVCGNHSLFNIARVFGGKLPEARASLVAQPIIETSSLELVLPFLKLHRLRRRRATTGSRELPVVTLDDNHTGDVKRGVLLGQKEDESPFVIFKNS